MALSLITDPIFSDSAVGALGRDQGLLNTLLAPRVPRPSLPALHINCDVVEKPNSYAIVAGGYRHPTLDGLTSDGGQDSLYSSFLTL